MKTTQKIIQGEGEAALELVLEWIKQEASTGALIFVVEGLFGAGKSSLVAYAAKSGVDALDLDSLLGKDVPVTERWTDRALARGALDELQRRLSLLKPFIFAGASALEVAQRLPTPLNPKLVRKIYIKKLSYRGEQLVWSDMEFESSTTHDRNHFFGSVRHRHVTEQPWIQADLIFERMPGEDGL